MEYYQLVTQSEKEAALAVGGISGGEASLLPDSKELYPKLSAAVSNNAYAEHLQRRIERNPRDLRSHTQRVLMRFSRGDAFAIFSAMADLFIVLGDLGYDLRHSLLMHVSEKLQADQLQFLTQRLQTGLRADEQLPDGSYSRLSQGGVENFPLVSQAGIACQQDDGVVLVQQYIDAGNIEQACRLLEQRVDADPGDQNACEKLLALYREHQLVNAFQASYYRFSGRSLAAPMSWQALDEHFKNRS